MKRIALLLASGALAVSLLPAQAQDAGVKQPRPKSEKEQQAVMAIFQAPDPDARMKAADALLLNFADTEFKAVALQVAAMAAQEKNDYEKMVIYAERTLEVDPKSYHAMIMLASGFAQRTREHDLDKEEKLSKAEKYARTALDLLKAAPKPRPDITDEQWEGAKKDIGAQAYEALGLAALQRKKYDDAITQFKLAIDTSAEPGPGDKGAPGLGIQQRRQVRRSCRDRGRTDGRSATAPDATPVRFARKDEGAQGQGSEKVGLLPNAGSLGVAGSPAGLHVSRPGASEPRADAQVARVRDQQRTGRPDHR